jgi:pyridoxal phosphate enzyme (YggS family)
VVGKAALIHSVDSLRLLDAIQAAAARQKVIQDVLFEVNIGGEPSKHGVAADEVWPLFDAAAGMCNVRVRGLMAIPPAYDNGLESQRYFAMMRRLMEIAKERRFENTVLDTLSMGMTASFEAAILEGATVVRIGTGIYGARE